MPRKPLQHGELPSYVTTIRRILRERGMTHAQLAAKMKPPLSKQALYAALNGGDIRMTTFFRMAEALGIPPHVLLTPPPPPPPEREVLESGTELNTAITLLLAELMKRR